jgi:mercuric ion binding protein
MKLIALMAAGVLALGAVGIETSIAAASTTAVAQNGTAKFAIGNMTCATCPITVKKAMSGVAGVRSVNVSFEAKSATVVFDPRRTNPAQIAAASANVGFPATLAR